MTPRKRESRRGATGWLAIALLLGLFALVAWQIVKTSSVDAFLRTNPFMAAQIAPRDPSVAMAIAMAEFRAMGGAVRPASRRAVIEATAQAPLADEPFFLAGMDALVAGDEAKAERLLEEAKRRNPRSRYSRLILLDRYLRTNRIEAATGEMGAIASLISGSHPLLITKLSGLAQDPATSLALEKALKKHPGLRDGMLEHLASAGADPDLILRLARNIPEIGSPGSAQAWQQKLVGALAVKGEVDRAYAMWRTFSAPGAPARKLGIYDADFSGKPGTPPFNWHFPATPAGVAERSPAGLQVDYYGRDGAELARQLLMLEPGRYRLSFVAEGAAKGESSRIVWQVQCLQSRNSLLNLPLRDVDYSPKRMAAEFTVPAEGCGAQWLRIAGAPAEFIKPQNAVIRNLRLVGVGKE